MKKILIGILFSLVAFIANADEASLLKNLKERYPNYKIKVWGPMPKPELKGFYEVSFNYKHLIAHESGRYLITDDIYDEDTDFHLLRKLRDDRMPELAEEEIAKLRESDFITFNTTSDKIGTLYVFTDLSCYGCEIHWEVAELQEGGVEVKYIASPYDKEGYEKSKQVMCADDRKKAITELKAGIDEGKYVKQHYNEECVESIIRGREAARDIGFRSPPFYYLSTGVIRRVSHYDARDIIKIFTMANKK